MKNYFLVILIAACGISCSKLGGDHAKTSELETRVKMLEQRLEEQDKFIQKAKEVLATHRTHILDMEKRIEVMTNSRFQPRATQHLQKKK